MKRAVVAAVLLGIIATLCVYAGLNPPELTLDKCLADPAKYDGAAIYSPRESQVETISKNGFTLRWGNRRIPVRGNFTGLAPDLYVQVKGVFHREGYIEARKIRTGAYRRLKIALSAAAAIIVFIVLVRGYRWDSIGHAFTRRK